MQTVTWLNLLNHLDPAVEGAEIYETARELFPLCRSITGHGLRQSLRLLRERVPMKLHEVPSGTPVLDWEVPKEWNIREAWIKNAAGDKIVDFARCNLHVVSYSGPVRQRMRLAELKQHVFTLPATPDWVPYRTSYYEETWGFCLSQRQWDALPDDEYEVCIDSTLEPGHLTYGEHRIQGQTDEEVLFSCHSCHPSLCNDNLSGMAIATRLATLLGTLPLRYSYRFLWAPGTIGAITWLAMNEEAVAKIKHGLVLSCLGDRGPFNYKRSRQGCAGIDRAAAVALRESAARFAMHDFVPHGYDERQYCSPGFNLPVGTLMRTPNGQYPEYHTSADDLSLIDPNALGESLALLLRTVWILETNQAFLNLCPKGEPQLGRRGLYKTIGGADDAPRIQTATLWLLNFSDGEHDLLDIAERSGFDFGTVQKAADVLVSHGLLQPLGRKKQ